MNQSVRNTIITSFLLVVVLLQVHPRGCRSRPTSRSPRCTTTFRSFRTRRVDLRRCSPTPTLTRFLTRSHMYTLSPTGSTSRRRRTKRLRAPETTCLVQRDLRKRTMRMKRRLLHPSGEALNLFLKLIRNMLKVSGTAVKVSQISTLLFLMCILNFCYLMFLHMGLSMLELLNKDTPISFSYTFESSHVGFQTKCLSFDGFSTLKLVLKLFLFQ